MKKRDVNKHHFDKKQVEKRRFTMKQRDLELQLAAVKAQQKALQLRVLDKRTPLQDEHLMNNHFFNTKRGGSTSRVSNGYLYSSGKSADINRSDENFEEKNLYLIEEMHGLLGEYTKTSLFSALSRSLPFDLQK